MRSIFKLFALLNQEVVNLNPYISCEFNFLFLEYNWTRDRGSGHFEFEVMFRTKTREKDNLTK